MTRQLPPMPPVKGRPIEDVGNENKHLRIALIVMTIIAQAAIALALGFYIGVTYR